MMWSYLRDRYYSVSAAVENSASVEGLQLLAENPAVKTALLHIEMAERAIDSIANEMLVKYHDEEDGN